MSDDKLATGSRLALEFFGAELLQKIGADARDDLPNSIGREYIAEVCFSSYNRPGLEFRERSMINIAMLVALNRAPELRLHIWAGLKNGLTEEQICEIIRHTMIYCGVPAGRDALRIASHIFHERKQAAEKSSGKERL
ncbi:hypothetical protein V2G26_019212 [Clonostachys chloroleuca]